MKLLIESKTVTIKVSKENIHFKTLEHYIRKNFQRVLRTNSSLLLIHSSEEQVMRNYMLQWVKNLIKIDTDLQNHDKLPVKIDFSNKNEIVHYLNIHIRLLQNKRLLLNLSEPNKKVVSRLLHYFNNENAREINNGKSIYIEVKKASSLVKLKHLLLKKQIGNSNVLFVYVKSQMHRFIESLRETNELQNRLLQSYRLLGSTKNSDMSNIKRNYKQLLKKYHPDRVFATNPAAVNVYTEKFQQVQNAYETIQKYHAS